MANNVLHIYGQGCWHDEVYIIGDAESLRALANAILRALSGKPGRGRTVDACTSDGEQYRVIVAYLDDGNILSRLAVPYTDPYAAEQREDALWVEAPIPEDPKVVSLRRWKAGRR